MLKPIPARILKHAATLKKPVTVDDWKKVTSYADTELTHVCIHPSNRTVKSTDNTEVTLTGIMFYDCRLSSPRNMDIKNMKNQADALGADMHVIFGSDTYTVEIVEVIYDDVGKYHHTEVGLI